MQGKQNSCKYYKIVRESAIPIINLNYEAGLTFQEDNDPIYMSRETRNLFNREKLDVLNWPSYSPDLNIIENIWSILADDIYGGYLMR